MITLPSNKEDLHCPWCGTVVNVSWDEKNLKVPCWSFKVASCPSCKEILIKLKIPVRPVFSDVAASFVTGDREFDEFFIYPKNPIRRQFAKPIPDELSKDYQEAATILNDSPNASAALSRRCLDHLLQRKAGGTGKNLSDDIDKVLQSGVLPPNLSERIDAIRQIGKFGAHPLKSTNTGQIIDVEPDEAEWSLDILKDLLEFYYVTQVQHEQKMESLNAKLDDAGKKGDVKKP